MRHSWSDFMGFNAVTHGVCNAGRPWNGKCSTFGDLVLKNGEKPDLGDPGLSSLFRAVGLKNVYEDTKISNFDEQLRSWNASHYQEGPGQHDMSLIRDLREECREFGWREVDGVMEALFGVIPSKIFLSSRWKLDPTDPGLDGGDCYTLELDVKGKKKTAAGGEVSFDFPDRWRAASSTPDRTLRMLQPLIDEHYDRFVSAENTQPLSRALEMADSSAPYRVTVRRNGRSISQIPVEPAEAGNGMVIKWAKINLLSDERSLVEALAGIAPAPEAKRIWGRHLQNDLGM
ncbi:hypothetical protein [Pseudomonas putida]|uniref:Uncharacterized protein n=1 Tax=Pseudomonas putida TaxID=303 RepID=A0A8I1ECD3_PSEPU|nr:hypothetical protein [Pseudomonas putida]MBI6882693.1 hypothetical protein [Pseudomonas putida]